MDGEITPRTWFFRFCALCKTLVRSSEGRELGWICSECRATVDLETILREFPIAGPYAVDLVDLVNKMASLGTPLIRLYPGEERFFLIWAMTLPSVVTIYTNGALEVGRKNFKTIHSVATYLLSRGAIEEE